MLYASGYDTKKALVYYENDKMETINVKATQDQLIRVTDGADKEIVKKGKTIQVPSNKIHYFLSKNFFICEEILADREIQTTDASTKKVIAKKGKVSKDNK